MYWTSYFVHFSSQLSMNHGNQCFLHYFMQKHCHQLLWGKWKIMCHCWCSQSATLDWWRNKTGCLCGGDFKNQAELWSGHVLSFDMFGSLPQELLCFTQGACQLGWGVIFSIMLFFHFVIFLHQVRVYLRQQQTEDPKARQGRQRSRWVFKDRAKIKWQRRNMDQLFWDLCSHCSHNFFTHPAPSLSCVEQTKYCLGKATEWASRIGLGCSCTNF